MRRLLYPLFLFVLLISVFPLSAKSQEIRGGDGFTCALGASGRAFCWGSNAAGQVGNGAGMSVTSVTSESRPVEIAGGFTTISSGSSHSCGLQLDGAAFCWGANGNGELGTGSTTAGISLPVRVQTDERFQAISAGATDTCAIDKSGAAWCWGSNADSKLGQAYPLVVFSAVPLRVSRSITPNPSFISISAGLRHTCAIDSTGKAWCWGNNINSRAGIDVNRCGGGDPLFDCIFAQPVETVASANGLTFQSLSAGDRTTCGIESAGSVRCWGDGFRGAAPPSPQTATLDTPSTVPGIAGAVSVSVGSTSACAVDGSGGLFCWGKDDQGQLGDGRSLPAASSVTPVPTTGTQDYAAVSVGLFDSIFLPNSTNTNIPHACGLTKSGAVRCWGGNSEGQLGQTLRTALRTSVPQTVPGLASMQITTGFSFGCSTDPVGVTSCWGHNAEGELGDGLSATVPLQSEVPTPVARFYLHTLIAKQPGKTAPPERLSSSMVTSKLITASTAAATFSRLAVGSQHACVLDSGGLAYCWGADFFGQIGAGNRTLATCRFGPGSGKTCVPSPTIVSRAAKDVFKGIAAGAAHTCGRQVSTNFVSCWGSSLAGELGSIVPCTPGPPCFRRQPGIIAVPFTSHPQMIDVSAGDSSSCSTNQNEVFCWGQIANSTTPVVEPYPPGPGYMRIGTGSGFACVGLPNGAVRCFGNNASGQLGDGTNTNSSTPTIVNAPFFSSFAVSRGFFDCGLDNAGGGVFCWGENQFGQLGNGSVINSNQPIQVSLAPTLSLSAVGVGFAHACAVATDGRMFCWGSNFSGELGNGQTSSSPTATAVPVAGGWHLP